MTKTNEFTPAQIKAIRKIIRDEIDRHDKRLEREDAEKWNERLSSESNGVQLLVSQSMK